MNKKMRARKRRQARRVALTLVLMLTVALVSIGGTIAWLTATTNTVTNTFTVGNISIELWEHQLVADTKKVNSTEVNANSYQLTPGTAYEKDPFVTVNANSEKCYLFVEYSEVNNPSTYLTYGYRFDNAGDDEWTAVPGETNVYYKVVEKSDADQTWYLLDAQDGNANGGVIVKDTIVKNGTTGTTAPVMPTAGQEPQIVFNAYAVQYDNLTVEAAWAQAEALKA